MNIDGSRDGDAWVRSTSHLDRAWRDLVHQHGYQCVREELRADLAKTYYGYRYLEPEDLAAPWTPTLLLCCYWALVLAYKYEAWHRLQHLPDGLPPSEETEGSTGERAFATIIRSLTEAGLHATARWAESRRDVFRQRVAWLNDRQGWVKFQVDLNSPSIFMVVEGPDQWHRIVEDVRAEKPDARHFLEGMRMASVRYIQRELPGPHADPTRKHIEGMPLGYGIRTDTPSFGYRREHLTDHLFVGWAAATMPKYDLFGTAFWPKDGGSVGSG